MSKVYIKTDNNGCIIACDGGYSIDNMGDMTGWILIDEGDGDRYNLCQNNYFDELYTNRSIPKYRYSNGKVVFRGDDEILSDEQNLGDEFAPTIEDIVNALIGGNGQ